MTTADVINDISVIFSFLFLQTRFVLRNLRRDSSPPIRDIQPAFLYLNRPKSPTLGSHHLCHQSRSRDLACRRQMTTQLFLSIFPATTAAITPGGSETRLPGRSKASSLLRWVRVMSRKLT
ncbi:hypothetical protein LINGRAHAP2_LOCUS11222 [Linum grandiflorum]